MLNFFNLFFPVQYSDLDEKEENSDDDVSYFDNCVICNELVCHKQDNQKQFVCFKCVNKKKCQYCKEYKVIFSNKRKGKIHESKLCEECDQKRRPRFKKKEKILLYEKYKNV